MFSWSQLTSGPSAFHPLRTSGSRAVQVSLRPMTLVSLRPPFSPERIVRGSHPSPISLPSSEKTSALRSVLMTARLWQSCRTSQMLP